MHCLERHVVVCIGWVSDGWYLCHLGSYVGSLQGIILHPTGVSKGMIGPRTATSWAHEPVDIFHVRLLESMIEPTAVPAVINIGRRKWSHRITGLMDGFLEPIWFPCRYSWDR